MALSSSEPRKKSTDVGHGLLIIQLCVSGHVGGWCAVLASASSMYRQSPVKSPDIKNSQGVHITHFIIFLQPTKALLSRLLPG